jgi:serine/threonine protein kinase/Tfp pilus assembly protein PilF
MTPERWQKLNQLFQSALKHEPGQRAAFLDQACAGDKSLRAEVENLLAAYHKAGSFIEAPAYAVAAQMLASDQNESLVGESFGPYRIVSVLGVGGMGEVYLAQDTRLGRNVALKLLPAYFTRDEKRVHRFQQEARAASALNHPNIITIHEIGQLEERHFIAMEFIDGETLGATLKGAHLKLRATLDVAIQIASALVAAHKAGIVHRDIKPENIMVRREDDLVKVLDFGLVKLTENQSPSQSSAPTRAFLKTAAGVVMGTPNYMSPEQTRGVEVDFRTDIWSLGVLVYEMASGRVPFAGETPSDVIASILTTHPPPLTRLAPEATTELERIVSKTLARDREGRYQTAKDLLIDLKKLKQRLDVEAEIARISTSESDRAMPGPSTLGGQAAVETGQRSATLTGGGSKVAPPASSAEYIVSEVKRHKIAAFVALAALAVAFTAAFIYFSYSGSRSRGVTSVAVLPFVNANGDPEIEYLSDGVAESLINSLSQLPQVKVIARSSSFRYKGKDADPQEVAKALGVEAILTGRVTQRGDSLVISAELMDARDRTQIWGEQYNRKATDILALQSEIARNIVNKLKLKIPGGEKGLDKHYTENNEAYQLYLKGRFYWNKRTGDSLKKSIEYFNQAIEKDPSFALAYAGLADCYLVPANPLPPREKMPKAKAAAMRALDLDETLAEAHTSLARVAHVYTWDWPGAEEEFKRALELKPGYATAHQWYGGYLETMGRYDEAIAERKLAQELDPFSPVINFEAGLAFYFARNYDEAIEQYQKTLELDPNFPPPHAWLPAAYEQKGMYDKAIAEFKDLIPQKDTIWLMAFATVGHIYAVSGKKDEAQAVLNQLKERSAQEYVPAYGIALVYAGLGEKDQAFAWLEKAYEERAFAIPQGLTRDPRWDNLRSDPRFAELVKRIGLPE